MKPKPVIMIPAYNPDDTLLKTLDAMKEAGFERFVVIDDGSRPEYRPVFERVAARPDCRLLRHAINLGKGRALKTGFNDALVAYPDAPGVVAMDADGQHPAEAALRVAQAMERYPDALVLGVRQFFKAENVPLPNMLGNTITRFVFWLLTGLRFGDTQCGLRGFPRGVVEALLPVEGDRFEYENVMLLRTRDFGIDTVEVPMAAVYIGDNASSHFRRLQDSLRIYSRLIGYAAVPLFMALLSLLFFREIRFLAPCWWWASLRLWSAAACAAATLAGWLVQLLWVPDRRFFAGLGGAVAAALLHGGLFAALFLWGGMTTTGAWWLAGLPAGLLSYRLWLWLRHGRRPRRTVYAQGFEGRP